MLPHLQKNSFGKPSKGLSENTPEKFGSPDSSNEEIKFTVPSNKLEKPKRNRSAFIIFSSEMRTKIQAEEKKKLNSNEIMVKLADLWKNLKDEERRRYTEMADKEKIKYLVELNQFYQTHPYEVIQNKTKKNHVKKPCSAYGLFLKDAKKIVKAEHPELKMADILKIVAEKWKKLSESHRKFYQEQAKTEKEVIKAKLTEHANNLEDEQNALVCLPQKRLQSQKRVKKALIRENMKQQNLQTEEQRVADVDTSATSPFEDAVFITEKPYQTNESVQSFSEVNNDELDQLPLLTFNSGRRLSIEPIFQDSDENNGTESSQPSENVDIEIMPEAKPKKSTEFLMDLLNFRSLQKNFDAATTYSFQNSINTKRSSCYTDFIGSAAETSRQVLNASLMKALAFEPSKEPEFDFLRYEKIVNEPFF